MSLKDPTAVDRYFGESFIQHDPNLADGPAGMKSFAAEVASSPAADITIYRTLVDGDLVLLHSKYQGVGRYARTAIALDLFRFSGGKIAEHWGGQEPEELPNSSRCFDLSGLIWRNAHIVQLRAVGRRSFGVRAYPWQIVR